jgi:uncharacterized damage-inducible protein DinB
MQDQLIEITKRGLIGKGIHINPNDALKELSATSARKKPNEHVHSCWELLHHILVWQNAMIDAIQGNDVDWDTIAKNNNWPSREMLSEDSKFNGLVDNFEKGIKKVKTLIEGVKFDDPMPAWENKPVIQGISVLLQHNSYHIGQIITTRKILGDLPPSDNY